MRKSAVLFLLLSLPGIVQSQNLDSLFNVFVNSRTLHENMYPVPPGTAGSHDNDPLSIKCGFGLNSIIRQNLGNFTTEQQKILKQLLARPSTDTSIVTPSGKFRIHFYTSGSFVPNYSGIDFPGGSDTLKIMMDSVAAAFDYAYDYEVNVLGYPPPPSDNGEGGDNLYDIYINSAGGGYGATTPESDLPGGRKTSYIEIHYSFNGFFTEGLNAVKVTAAHELHHAIQIGNYIYNPDEFYYYEITSTSMEEFVHDEVNDYYAYIPNYFNNPDRTFSRFVANYDGYDLAIWNIFLKERFDFDIIKKIWERISGGATALEAISSAIFEYGSTFKDEFNLFGQQIVFTNYRSASSTIFDEAGNYPLLKLPAAYAGSKTVTVNSNIAANNYLLFAINKGSYTDSLISIITNSDINDNISFTYDFLTSSANDASKIINNYYYRLNSSDAGMLKHSNIFNNEPVTEETKGKSEIEFAFPQPFNYNKNSFIYLPVAANQTGEAFLSVYSVAMDLVYSGSSYIVPGNQIKLKWNGLDKNNEKLPTGVYIYVTKSGDNIKKGKLVIYNE